MLELSCTVVGNGTILWQSLTDSTKNILIKLNISFPYVSKLPILGYSREMTEQIHKETHK